ncbi:DUF58 domain-containing protein [Algihabitans albus]|uniref:DUF58 domain-containing protein n=1 Tax=Algihabitans albus TaxID=2164067 RepID=UPI000E5D2757|nr:DUF58 domain-containing protein [Algihabitans albus]
MRDVAARGRAGLTEKSRVRPLADPRVHVDLAHLRRIEGQARTLSFLPRRSLRSVLNGRHASRLRGRGLNFEELRGYLPGDDTRAIDWKVTARIGKPHLRVYTEERDRPALIVVDQRMSMFFGSRHNMKSVTAAEAAALAAFRILDQGDRVGGIVFGDEAIAEVRLQRSRKALDRLLAALAAANGRLKAAAPTVEPLPLNQVLTAVARIAPRDHLIPIISDFDRIDARTEARLGGLARHNDVLFCPVTDPMAQELPDDLRVVVSDGCLQAEIELESRVVRRALIEIASGRLAFLFAWQARLGLPLLPLDAGAPTLPQLRKLMGHPGARR